MNTNVHIVGVGMIPFTKPGRSGTYSEMGEQAALAALSDAGVDYSLIEQAYVGYVYGDSTSGQAALYGIGQTAIPIVNVNNNCSTGSTALWLAQQAISSGAIDCALALGFEQMAPGALGANWSDRPFPLARMEMTRNELQGTDTQAPTAAQFFGGAGKAYVDEFDVDPTIFAEISVKARKHAANNPNAVFRDAVTIEEVLASPQIYGPLTRLQCCPPTCGAAAAVLCSPDFARKHNLDAQVRIAAQSLTTDMPGVFTGGDMRKVIGAEMTSAAACSVYEASGVSPQDIPVVELHDCFTTNEFLTYELLQLTPIGTAEKFIRDGDNTYGGRVVTNPSGGLLSKGHPIGATGLAQCAELVWQLRGQAGARQVEGAHIALQHNLGLGGACVVTLYERVDAL